MLVFLRTSGLDSQVGIAECSANGDFSATEVSMSERSHTDAKQSSQIVKAMGEEPIFKVGGDVRISVRFPVGHYRVPRYVRGKRGSVEAVIDPPGINNEEEA